MSEIITWPSGLSGRIRAMKVREELILTDRKLAKASGQVDELLSACWERRPLTRGPTTAGTRRSTGAGCSRATASTRCCRSAP